MLILGGSVIDGTGTPAHRADVVVVGDRIAAITRLPREIAARIDARYRIDARGMVITPGFIDVHAHGDPLRRPGFENFLAMGVTTICLGLDGASPWRGGPAAWFEDVANRRPGVNVGAFVGHGTVRQAIVADVDRPATPVECARMAGAVGAALEAGALGLSTGLEYTPGRFADRHELIEVARPLGATRGLVASHVRNEDDDALDASIDELLAQCEATGAAAHLSHAKVVFGHGAGRAETALDRLAAARARGIRASADVYPYVASYTGLALLFPAWARAPNHYEAAVAARRGELAQHLRQRVVMRNGPEATLFGSGPYAGSTLAAAAMESGVPYEDLLIELGPGGASAAYFVMAPEVMERFLIDPFVMVASDGSSTMRHPRGHGTFARVIEEYVVNRGLLTLPEAVRKMTSLPAETVGLRHRGRLAAGAAADILVFDPNAVDERASFEQPFRRTAGFTHVLVGGQFALRGGAPTGIRAGRVLRRGR